MSETRETPVERAIQLFLAKGQAPCHACACLGHGPDKPACPCGMFWHVEVDGDYYRIESKTESGELVYRAYDIGPGPFLAVELRSRQPT